MFDDDNVTNDGKDMIFVIVMRIDKTSNKFYLKFYFT